MSNSRHLALGLALLAALALVAQRADAGALSQWPEDTVTASVSDRDDGRPPTTGPTNPTGF